MPPFPQFQRPRRNPIDRALAEMPMYQTAPSVDTLPSALPSELDPAYEPQNQPQEIPLNGRRPLAADLSSLNIRPAPGPSRLDQLESDYRRVGAPPESFKGKLAQALITMAPTALGAAFGGTYGAAGAAEGTLEGLETKRQQENLTRKSLLEEMENERQRQERMQERQLVSETTRRGQDIRQQEVNEQIAQRRDTHQPVTQIGDRMMQWNPQTQRYDIDAGAMPAPKTEPKPRALQIKGGTRGGKRTFANYDPDSGQFFDQSGHIVTDFEPAEAKPAADERYAELYRKDKMGTATADEKLELEALNKRLTLPGVARAEATVQGQDIATRRKEVATKYNDLTGAQKLFKSMVAAKAESERAEKTRGNAGASDMALVSSHMNMTVGAIKGARTGKDIIQAHMQARSWPEEVKVAAMAVLDGRKLSSQQREMFVRLAQERLNEYYDDYDQAKDVWSYTPRGDEKLDRSLYRKSLGEDLNQINVIAPDGRSGRIPAEDWPAAEKQGYKKR